MALVNTWTPASRNVSVDLESHSYNTTKAGAFYNTISIITE